MFFEELPPFTDDILLADIDLKGIVRLGFGRSKIVDVDFDRRLFLNQQTGPTLWPFYGEWQAFFGSGAVSRFQFFEKENPFNDGPAWAHSTERLSAEKPMNAALHNPKNADPRSSVAQAPVKYPTPPTPQRRLLDRG
ncbi:hypothetical protein [Cryobacterium sp. GrIS_2_6]|uniref:hypothetical protein n=1 Tax=Cryobacterium sp. GrIS_2_6 TaxID=3162785 RepID=UPI002DF9B59A|nr:hypothetical protein [Cryobacterium psychrotolerans]